MKVLVTGAEGQLGKSLQATAKDFPHFTLLFKSRSELDITDATAVEHCIQEQQIETVINCAAYTAVDLAENEKEKAHEINVVGVNNLVHALERVNGKLIHISTDYVFDGKAHSPYNETDQKNPQSVYGATKSLGEDIVFQSQLEAIVVRTSWVFSPYGNNFVKTMIRLMRERESVSVVNDQIGQPTYAPFLAEALLQLLNAQHPLSEKGKCYHYAQQGSCSWFEFAEEIQRLSPFSCAVLPIATEDFPTQAPRPQYSVLSTAKIQTDFNLTMVSWQTALKACMDTLNLAI